MNSNDHHQPKAGKPLIISIFLNILITGGQITGGLISGSLSLISDALHNLSDVITLIISFFALKIAQKKQTVKRTFGYKRAEIMAAFINAVSLLAVSIFLVNSAIRRLYQPEEIESTVVIIFSGIAILINGFSAYLLHSGSRKSLNIRSAYLHLLSDMMTSVAVLIAGILMHFFNIYWIDGILTLVIAIYLIIITWRLLLESLKDLMLFTPSSIVLETIREKLSDIAEVQNIHHVHVWQMDNKKIYFEGHVDFVENLSLMDVNIVLNKIRKVLQEQFNIDHVTLQPEYDTCEKKDLVSQDH